MTVSRHDFPEGPAHLTYELAAKVNKVLHVLPHATLISDLHNYELQKYPVWTAFMAEMGDCVERTAILRVFWHIVHHHRSVPDMTIALLQTYTYDAIVWLFVDNKQSAAFVLNAFENLSQ